MISDLQATVLRQGEELRLLKQQQAPAVASVTEAPPVSLPAAGQLPEVGNKWKPLYERFRKQQPPVF